ncbi:MAG: YeeE/YedE thiosulfate transporter family protein [Geminicoccaceae bacterium]
MLCLGLAAGLVLQRTQFCTMGCISDAVLFGSLRRLRIWALALAVALGGSQLLDSLGWVQLSASVYRAEGWIFAGALPGGVLFGFGMVLAGGCVSRNLVRLGSGSGKAAATLLVAAVAALATVTMLPSPSAASTHDHPAVLHIIAAVIVVGLLVFSLRARMLRVSRQDLITGLTVGSLVPLGWIATSLAGVRPDSLNLMALHRLELVVPLAVGTVLGAFLMAWRRGELRIERFTARDDLVRNLLGGVLMGVGGTLALGCTIGQGLTGASTLSPGSLLVLAAMFLGAWWAVKYLETGRLLALPIRATELR